MKLLKLIPLIFILCACSQPKSNDVVISDAWVRESAPGQNVGAAYMTLNSPTKNTLVSVDAVNTAASVEIHSMTMNDGVMKMRMLEELPLQPNKPVSLKPGSFHFMLFDLKAPLIIGQTVTFRMHFKGQDGKMTEQETTLPIKSEE